MRKKKKKIHLTGKQIRQAKYRLYLKGDWWKKRRKIAIERAGHSCEDCGGRCRLTVHHKTYVRLGCEEDSDLVVLCGHCHKARHQNTGRKSSIAKHRKTHKQARPVGVSRVLWRDRSICAMSYEGYLKSKE